MYAMWEGEEGMSTLIGLTGKKQSGKSTVGKMLMDNLSFYGISYAYGIKKFLSETYYPLLTDAHLNGDLKEVEIPELGCSARYLMQEVGQGLRDVDPSIWLRQVESLIVLNPTHNFVITDVRYDNEMIQIWRLGGEIWEIKREPYTLEDGHKSENSITLAPDVQILNNGTIEELENVVAHIFAEER